MTKIARERAVQGRVRKKTLEPVGLVEETSPRGSRRLMKARMSDHTSTVEVAGRDDTHCGLREERSSKATVKRGRPEEASADRVCGIKKAYLRSHGSCRLTFVLPKAAVGQAEHVAIVGDFNEWDQEASPMKKRRSGDFAITLALPTGREYRFRYLIDGHRWENDWCADRYEPNPHGCDDSVVIV